MCHPSVRFTCCSGLLCYSSLVDTHMQPLLYCVDPKICCLTGDSGWLGHWCAVWCASDSHASLERKEDPEPRLTDFVYCSCLFFFLKESIMCKHRTSCSAGNRCMVFQGCSSVVSSRFTVLRAALPKACVSQHWNVSSFWLCELNYFCYLNTFVQGVFMLFFYFTNAMPLCSPIW